MFVTNRTLLTCDFLNLEVSIFDWDPECTFRQYDFLSGRWSSSCPFRILPLASNKIWMLESALENKKKY